MQTKIIHICDTAEAKTLWDEGMFQTLVKEHLDKNYNGGLLKAIYEFRDKNGCLLTEAKSIVEKTFVDEELDTLLQYSEDGAVCCSIYKPQVMRKIGNVWVPVRNYDEQVPWDTMFSPVYTCTIRGLDQLKSRSVTNMDAKRIFDSMENGCPFVVSDNEVWKRENKIDCFYVYRAGTLGCERFFCRSFNFRDFLESRFARRKAAFGEF